MGKWNNVKQAVPGFEDYAKLFKYKYIIHLNAFYMGKK